MERERLKKLLIAGLGNIGEEYAHTRHNIGFDIIDAWVEKENAKWEKSILADKANIEKQGVKIHCIKPTVYMNLSGKAVVYWLHRLGLSPRELLVIVDDLAFPLGTIKMRMQGNDGGHNGLKSIYQEIKTADYARLRCGIGNDFPKGRQVDFVLGKWRKDEEPALRAMIAQGVDAIDAIIKSNLFLAMNAINSAGKKID